MLPFVVSELELRYDDMLSQKERVTSRYQTDYKKWKEACRVKTTQDNWRLEYEDEPDITLEERKKRVLLMQEHRKILMKTKHQSSTTRGAALLYFTSVLFLKSSAEPTSNSPRLSIHRNNDKENERTPTPLLQKRRFGSENMPPPSPGKGITTPPLPLRNTLLKSVTNMGPPSSSPTVFLDNNPSTTRMPFTLPMQPISDTIKIMEEPM